MLVLKVLLQLKGQSADFTDKVEVMGRSPRRREELFTVQENDPDDVRGLLGLESVVQAGCVNDVMRNGDL